MFTKFRHTVEQTGGYDFSIKGKKKKRKFQLVKPGAQLSIVVTKPFLFVHLAP